MVEVAKEIQVEKISTVTFKVSDSYDMRTVGKLKKMLTNETNENTDIEEYILNKFSRFHGSNGQSVYLSNEFKEILKEKKVSHIKLFVSFRLQNGIIRKILMWDNINGFYTKEYEELKKEDDALSNMILKSKIINIYE